MAEALPLLLWRRPLPSIIRLARCLGSAAALAPHARRARRRLAVASVWVCGGASRAAAAVSRVAGTTLVLFGGTSSVWADMHNSTYEFSTARKVWQQVAVSGGPVTPRSAHSAVVCSLSNGCETSDGRPRMFVFGGWGLAPCGGSRPCLTHQDEL